ncbi:MAG: endonuclease/exonuclease/phosphatase family protein [Chlorobi bacterium]|nr:endonuclease/exonuclease/phosphatase family protein [Chlorobiota bacterium]
MKRALLKILFVINLVIVLLLISSYISVYIPPDKWWIPAFLGLAYPYILVANLFFIVLWLLLKPMYLFISLIAVLTGWNYINRYFQLNGKVTEAPAIKVISYNVKHFKSKGDRSSKANADSIRYFLKQQDADIICLQEVRLRTNKIFNLPGVVKELPGISHYQYARTSSTGGSATLTRYPIINMGEIRFKKSGNMAIYTDVLIREDTVRIVNLHLQSYHIDPSQYSKINFQRISEEDDIRKMKKMGSKFKQAFIKRAVQARRIREFIDNSPYNVIVCGDFNDTPVSYAYRTVKGNLNDAFIQSGKGFGRTYIGELPSFRIDYIFHSDGFNSYNFQSEEFVFSDHLPVSCSLVQNR